MARTIVMYLIIASFLILEIRAAVNPAQPITTLKNRVKTASSDLERFNRNMMFNVRNKLNNLKINEMGNVNTAVNSALDTTRTQITAANNGGHNAEHCYEPLRSLLNTASKKAFSGFEKCVEDQLIPIKEVEKNIEGQISKGKLMLSELDGIAISCAHGTSMDMMICIGQKLPNASLTVKNYEDTGKLLKDSGTSLSSTAEIGGIKCFQTEKNELSQSVTLGRIEANQCIKNV